MGVDPAWRAVTAWEGACGPTIAARTSAERMRGRVLYVRVPSAGWAQDLGFVKEELLVRLCARARVKVEDIRFQVGPVAEAAPTAAPGLPPPPPPAGPRTARAVEAAVHAGVRDPELRAALVALGLRIVRDRPRP